MDNELYKEINRKLDVVLKLLAYGIVSEKNVSQGAPILKRLGLTTSEIAEVYETTANAINARLAEAKKKR